MAGNAIIGALRVVLGADTAALDKGLKDAQSSIATFGRQLDTAAAALAASFAVAMGGVALSIKKSLEEADKLGKLAQSVGLPVEELSKLKHAADLSDVSIEDFGKAIVKLSKNMSDVAGGGAGPAAEAFRKMGVSVIESNGTLKSSGQVLEEVADKFEGYKDGAAKSALAVAIFGKAGANMIPLLNAGKDGLKEAKQEAEEFGLVIDKKTAVAAEAFNDNMTRLHKVMDGVSLQVMAYLAPNLEMLSSAMVQLAKDGGVVKNVVDAIQTAILVTAREVALFAVGLQRIGIEAVALKDLLASLTTFDASKIGAAWEAFQATGAATNKQLSETKQIFDSLQGAAVNAGSAMAGAFLQSPISGMLYDFRSLQKEVIATGTAFLQTTAPVLGAKSALESYIDSQKKSIAAREAEAQTIGKDIGEREKLRVALEGEAIAKANHIKLNDELKAKLDAVGVSAANAAIKLAGAQMTEEMLLPWQKFNNELEKNKQLFDAGAISAETYARANQVAAEQAGNTWGIAGASIAGSFKDIAGAFGKENSKMARAAQVFGIIQGTISMFTGAAKALELPFPANLAAMAAVLAKGASLVASIKSQNVPAMKTGGAITVPGGIGGGDRVRAMVDLEPGEQLDVWKPGDGNADPRRGGGPATEVTLNMVGEVFNRETLRRLIESLNDMSADGYRLKVA